MDDFSGVFWASLGAFALVQFFVFRTNTSGRARPGLESGEEERRWEDARSRRGYLPAYKCHRMRRYANLSDEATDFPAMRPGEERRAS